MDFAVYHPGEIILGPSKTWAGPVRCSAPSQWGQVMYEAPSSPLTAGTTTSTFATST